jgi:hypothetical protein
MACNRDIFTFFFFLLFYFTQNIKQPGRPLHYLRDIISDEESMDNEDEAQNGKQHPWQTVAKNEN